MTNEALLESGTVKVEYLYSEATGPTITGLYMNIGGSDFMDFTSSLQFSEVRDKYTFMLNEKIKESNGVNA